MSKKTMWEKGSDGAFFATFAKNRISIKETGGKLSDLYTISYLGFESPEQPGLSNAKEQASSFAKDTLKEMINIIPLTSREEAASKLKPGTYVHHSGRAYNVLFVAEHKTNKLLGLQVCYINNEDLSYWSRPLESFDMDFLYEKEYHEKTAIVTNQHAKNPSYEIRRFKFEGDRWVWF